MSGDELDDKPAVLPHWLSLTCKFLLTYICLTLPFLDLEYFKPLKELVEGSKMGLSDFNSVFEVAVGFGFAYGAIIKFRIGTKRRVFENVMGNLVNKFNSRFSKIIVSENTTIPIQVIASLLISDLTKRMRAEIANSQGEKEHRIKDCLIYFAFFALVCIVNAGLLDSINSVEPAVFELQLRIMVFTLIFSVLSYIAVEIKYEYYKDPNFEGTLLIFAGFLLISYAVTIYTNPARFISILDKRYFMDISTPNALNSRKFFNYVTLIVITLQAFPYFLYFRKLYILSFLYISLSFFVFPIAVFAKYVRLSVILIVRVVKEVRVQQVGKFTAFLVSFIRNFLKKF
ncbi:hypothetical protein [Dyadobacter aurulentus]|uniref:hypothetical protein n=1 Tax=Dyadobacter sp. UC 10 TaxID=2605428 RepID=UPI0011F2490C|nr:hypothetical protein [Dyadobacter sp. UC 10]KAA0992655.1 hypothetical protein FXO21_22010 [Dyadobacter sp. UC 10]